ncbi:MAG TPA: NADH-quinone oxidoreductase subunit NuoH [Prosthecochloris aestuarii]|uniref:NADH-quinone oxidoreductase subunit H n=1 Tax=Prosthecochloris aestuarii TaxID=1102 RepID=A0A831SRN3_PROAE|nr:NADH-quinone oxidoreductase subunit NuoH [Prosthecochloris aestuarii]
MFMSMSLNSWSDALSQWVPFGVPLGLVVVAAIPLVFIALYALTYGVYGERKISAFTQDRLGPMEVGFWGLLQTLADILKLLQKEDIVNRDADKFLFVVGPGILFVGAFLAFAVLPFGPEFIGADLNVGLFYAIGIVALEVVGILAAGWGSNNKWALYGAIRSVAQIVSYEIPAAIAILCGAMMAGTLSMQQFSVLQQGEYGFLHFFLFQNPIAWLPFIIYFIASLAETNRAPFDIPEAESELVAGYFTEYSGMKFAVIFLAEYGSMFMVSAIISIVFLGGWNSPLPNIGTFTLNDWTTGPVWGVFWIVSKGFFFIFIQMWLRWTLPRLRVDQLMYLCWKVLTPFAFLAFVLTAVWEIYMK